MTLLPTDAQRRCRAELQVLNIQLRNLRHPSAGVIHGRKHHSITMTTPSRRVGSVEERGHFFAREIRHHPSIEAFDRDGKGTGDGCRGGGILQGRIAEKRTEGGEAQIPASNAVVPLALERVEKGENLRSVEVSERQGGGRLSKTLLAELQK